MLILGGRLLFVAVLAWSYEALVYLHGGAWPNLAWADLIGLVGGDYGITLAQYYLHTPAAFFEAPIGTSCFTAGLPLFAVGLAGFGRTRRKTTA